MPESEVTPIDRPLMLSDLNEIKRIVHNIETIQLRWYQESVVLTERVTLLERRLWWPTFVSIMVASLALAVALMTRLER